jgi:hypothetical protein
MGMMANIMQRMSIKRIAKWAGVFALLICCFACTGFAQDMNKPAELSWKSES